MSAECLPCCKRGCPKCDLPELRDQVEMLTTKLSLAEELLKDMECYCSRLNPQEYQLGRRCRVCRYRQGTG